MTQLPLTAALCAVLVTVGVRAQDAEKGQEHPAKTSAPLSVGSAIPADLKLKDIDGKEFAFKDQLGKIVVVHFWSITCPWETVAEPKIQKLCADYKDKDVVFVAINANKGEIGSELQYPLAVVMLGGLVSSTFLNLYVVPVGFALFGGGPRRNAAADVIAVRS